jgi:hypothetical protein
MIIAMLMLSISVDSIKRPLPPVRAVDKMGLSLEAFS